MGRQPSVTRRIRTREELVQWFQYFGVEVSRPDGVAARADVVVCMDEPLAAEALAQAVIAKAGWRWQSVFANRLLRTSQRHAHPRIGVLIARAVRHVVAWEIAHDVDCTGMRKIDADAS